jgi:hypothetical protein
MMLSISLLNKAVPVLLLGAQNDAALRGIDAEVSDSEAITKVSSRAKLSRTCHF